MDTPVLESCMKASSIQLMVCGGELNSNSDTTAHSVKDTRYAARFFYNSAVRPRDIDNLLAKKILKNALNGSKIVVKIRILDVVSILVSILIQRKSQTKTLVVNVHCLVSLLSNLSCVHTHPVVSM